MGEICEVRYQSFEGPTTPGGKVQVFSVYQKDLIGAKEILSSKFADRNYGLNGEEQYLIDGAVVDSSNGSLRMIFDISDKAVERIAEELGLPLGSDRF